jgi:MoxR-like ATPase
MEDMQMNLGENRLTDEEVTWGKGLIDRITESIDTVIQGKHDEVLLVVLAMVARGHVLLEDLPGTGKTTLASTLAKSVDVGFRRIQFTPDVMPSDVSGFSIFNQKTLDFEFRPGSVMSNLVLADEINRASAKTQSALLEAMEERQVTVDGTTRKLPEPFMVLATQNPIEQFGTYALPEAQLDRFTICLSLGYPEFQQEVKVLKLRDRAKRAVRAVAAGEDIIRAGELSDRVHVSDPVFRYIVEVVSATRECSELQVGSSPRGSLALLGMSSAYALSQGRNYVLPDDVRLMAVPVLAHRVTLGHEAKVNGRKSRDVISSLVAGIALPM